jgi:hypothetical protein
MIRIKIAVLSQMILLSGILTGCKNSDHADLPVSYSGIYPSLAYYNLEGECGAGALVPWADRLWLVTYGPHLPFGSSDKLYEITPGLHQLIRNESQGGTHANRMIHRESRQLFIGPYVIDELGKVRVIPFTDAPGRYTGNARHLFDPSDKLYIGTMEEGLYEVNVKTLKVKTLYPDGNVKKEKGDDTSANIDVSILPGAHGKGIYSGQGVVVYSNNGEASDEALSSFDIESGVLAEWDGRNWKVIRRNQFMEVTGPGGIFGNDNPAFDPIWVTGFDHKSIIIGVRDDGRWNFYRLPKASHSYDGAHGWNTEWPRIRDVGTAKDPEYLMTMHGMFWHFPRDFRQGNTSGIRPRSAYLKIIGDFTRWNNLLVFGCDDAAQKEFLNKRRAKGTILGPGQSNSNLWFTSLELPDSLGPNNAEGAVWMKEKTEAGVPSEPFLFAGWEKRCAWVHNYGSDEALIRFETDKEGNRIWEPLLTVKAGNGESKFIGFDADSPGEWIRVISDSHVIATVHFSYADTERRGVEPSDIFDGLAEVDDTLGTGGLLYGLGDNRRSLGISVFRFEDGRNEQVGYYELAGNMELLGRNDQETLEFINEKFTIPANVVSMEGSSVLITDDKGRRWRLPAGNPGFAGLTESSLLRICREVVTERDLFNCMGTFYELPAENADGFAKIRPIASHNYRIHDYCSFRGMLIMTGISDTRGKENPHIIRSADGKAALWAGAIDDLWKMGKPVGVGGPWKNSSVKAGEPSDPYLIGLYDKRTLYLSHNSSSGIGFVIEADPDGSGSWMTYRKICVEPGVGQEFIFPDNFQARWIRFSTDHDCTATAFLVYQ